MVSAMLYGFEKIYLWMAVTDDRNRRLMKRWWAVLDGIPEQIVVASMAGMMMAKDI